MKSVVRALVLAMTGFLLPAAGVAATCVGNVTDDFNDGALAPRWTIVEQACGSISESSGALQLARGNCKGNLVVYMNRTQEIICGDFDLTVDFALSNFTVPSAGSRYVSFGVRTVDLAHHAVIERYNRFAAGDCTPSTSNYKAWASNSLNCASIMSPTSAQSGRFRLRRAGSSILFYVWNGSWVHLGTKTFPADDVFIIFYTGQDVATTSFTARFDNLEIRSAVPLTGLCEDFSSAVLDPMWQPTTACGTPAIVNGELQLAKSAGCTGGPYLTQHPQVSMLRGDFDVSAEFTLASFPVPPVQSPAGVRWFSLQVHPVSNSSTGNFAAGMQVYSRQPGDCANYGRNYKAFTANAVNCVASWANASGEDAGKLRIARTGNVFRMYYWEESTNDWHLLRTETGTVRDVVVRLSSGAAGDTGAHVGTFDHIMINADNIECVGAVSGLLTADCNGSIVPLLGVLVDAYEVGSGELAGSDTTDASGAFTIHGLPIGENMLTVVPPLGYEASSAEVAVTINFGETSTANVQLHCLPLADNARGMGFWKHQVGVATGAGGYAEVDSTALCGFLDTIEAHFNSNALNQVVIYDPPASATYAEKLLVAKELLNLKGNVGMTARAKQHLMSLLLNVAGNYLGLRKSVSVDGSTVSQAITYCDLLLDDVDPANDYLVKDIAEKINGGVEIAAGVIPLDTDDIAYAPEREGGAAFVFGLERAQPNPFNPQTTIAYSIKTQGPVQMKVYDVRGALVRVLVNGIQAPGNRKVVWDGVGDRGERVASGIYFVRLESHGEMLTRKIAMLK
jgi:hypothetical protein